MKIEYNYENSILQFKFHFENTDHTHYKTFERKHIDKAHNICTYQLPESFNIQQLSNDRLALAIILNIYSFIGKRIVLPFKTSDQFNKIVLQNIKCTIINKPEYGMTRFDKNNDIHNHNWSLILYLLHFKGISRLVTILVGFLGFNCFSCICNNTSRNDPFHYILYQKG